VLIFRHTLVFARYCDKHVAVCRSAGKGVDLTGLLGGHRRRLGDGSPPAGSMGGARLGRGSSPPEAEAFL